MNSSRLATFSIVAAVALSTFAACSSGDDCLAGKECNDSHGGGAGSSDDDGAAAAAAGAASCSADLVGKSHVGLGGDELAAKADGPASGDRARTKPYSALLTEYARVLGAANAPALIDSTGPTFGVAGDRWFLEPLASAVLVDTAYDVAFEGCLKLTGDVAGGTSDAKYAEAPTTDTARSVCTEWTRRFWSRAATPGQIDACVAGVLEAKSETYGRPSVDETTRATTPKRQWAYACASVLTSTSFLTF